MAGPDVDDLPDRQTATDDSPARTGPKASDLPARVGEPAGPVPSTVRGPRASDLNAPPVPPEPADPQGVRCRRR